VLFHPEPWWEVDLGTNARIKEIRILSAQTPRLSNSIVTLKDENDHEVAWYQFGSVDWADYTLTMDSFTLVKSMNPMRIDQSQPIDLASDKVHWLRCIRYNQNGCTNPDKTPTLASNDEVHPIACCSDTSKTDPWAKAPSDLSPIPPSWCPYRLSLESDQIPEADQCKSGTFDEAVAYCKKYGGRLCTSAEFENNCAANSGCQWSQGVGNGEVAWADDQSNTQFPAAYNWIIDPTSGIRTINPDNTYEYAVLSNKPEDLFCGASQGPPSVLAEACDASMEFLLGPGVSIGFLTSTANDVNECELEFVVLYMYCVFCHFSYNLINTLIHS